MLQHKGIYVRTMIEKQEFSMKKYIHKLTMKDHFYRWKSEGAL